MAKDEETEKRFGKLEDRMFTFQEEFSAVKVLTEKHANEIDSLHTSRHKLSGKLQAHEARITNTEGDVTEVKQTLDKFADKFDKFAEKADKAINALTSYKKQLIAAIAVLVFIASVILNYIPTMFP